MIVIKVEVPPHYSTSKAGKDYQTPAAANKRPFYDMRNFEPGYFDKNI
jgi:hypothetical protein